MRDGKQQDKSLASSDRNLQNHLFDYICMVDD